MSSGLSGGMGEQWERLINEALIAFDSGNLRDFQLPAEMLANLKPEAAIHIRMTILSIAFERWLQQEFKPGVRRQTL